MMAFYPGMGGLYKSIDNGITWELAGLFGAQIEDITSNEACDLFIGIFQSFEPIESSIYAVYHNGPELFACPFEGGSTNTLKINTSGDIYAGCEAWQAGLGLSVNNGNTFNLVYTNYNFGLRLLTFDNQDFLYAVPNGTTALAFYRSSNSTFTSVKKPLIKTNSIEISPNPAINSITVSNTNNLNTITRVGVYTMQGIQQISMQNCHQNKFEIDVSSLNAGVYCIEIHTKEGIETQKLVIR